MLEGEQGRHPVPMLALPALDQPQVKGINRDLLFDPLDLMLATISNANNPPQTRKLKLVNHAQDKGWVVDQVGVVMRRQYAIWNLL